MLILGNNPRYATTGHLLFGTPDGRLMAAPFDVERTELTGPPIPVEEGLSNSALRGVLDYTISLTGALVYRAGDSRAGGEEFVWVSRSGQARPVDAGFRVNLPGVYGLRLSPDETRIVFNSLIDGNDDVRIKHLPDGPVERITFNERSDFRPFWTPDGQSVTYVRGPSAEDRNAWSRRADGTGEPVLVLDDERSLGQGLWSHDGEWMVFRTAANAEMGFGLRDIFAFRPGVDTVATGLVLSAEFMEQSPALSPGDRWLAYNSDETGRDEVFVRPFPDVDSGRVRVSADGGVGPLWAQNGRELFYVNEDRGLVAVQFDQATGRALTQETLFTIPPGYLVSPGNYFYDVTSDGEQFLMVRSYGLGEGASTSLVLVLNFHEELKRLVPNN